ncbi:unnamed protein product [Ixodes hexagonus]
MAAGDCDPISTKTYCLSGFSDALDWRPLLFQELIIAQNACSLCGVVSRKAVKLSCAHTLCPDCHADSVERGNACPLDQELFCEHDIIQQDVSDGYLGKRKVACWNAFSGCSFVGPVTSLLDHYKKCKFHVVSCTRCNSSIVRSEMVGHCKNDCSVPPTKQVPSSIRIALDYDHIEKTGDELKQAMLKISEDIMFLQTSLNQCREDIREGERRSKKRLQAQSSALTEQLTSLSVLCTSGFAEEQHALNKAAANITNAVKAASADGRTLHCASSTTSVVSSCSRLHSMGCGDLAPTRLPWHPSAIMSATTWAVVFSRMLSSWTTVMLSTQSITSVSSVSSVTAGYEVIYCTGSIPSSQGSVQSGLQREEKAGATLEKRGPPLLSSVACWNISNGCDFVGAMDCLLDHFKKCAFHMVSCPRCHSPVLRQNIVQHYKESGCDLTDTKTPVDRPVTRDLDSVEEACLEVKEAVAKISEDLMSLQTSLNICCENIRAVDSKCERHLEVQAMSLAGQISDLSQLCTEGFSEERRTIQGAKADFKDHLGRELSGAGDRMTEATNKLSQNLAGVCGPKTSHWYFIFWEDLKRRALKKGYADFFGPVRDMFGYRVCICVDIGKEEDDVLRFGCFLTIYDGEKDGELEWPFSKIYTVGVVHPADKSNVICRQVDASKYSELKNFQKPKEGKNLGFGDPYLSSPDKLESDGFVSNGKLHLFLTIEQ